MEFDKIIITNLPAFYKVNLFNEIAKSQNIFVLFTGNTSELRNEDFFKKELIQFSFIDLKDRNKILNFSYIFKLILFSKYKELIIGGWDEPILWFSALISRKKKNSIIVESSIYESKTIGLKAKLKKLILTRISTAYASGSAQVSLLKELNFRGKIKKTKGVGLFNIKDQPHFEERSEVKNFLYIGRLSPEKNLIKLVEVFNELPDLNLYIVGFGPQEDTLKSLAFNNIFFLGAIMNDDVFNLYRKFDVFILPSLIEPWGLVIEEALNNGIPVIVSNNVGCSEEIVVHNGNGLIFLTQDSNGLSSSVKKITDVSFYNKLRKNVSKLNFQDTLKEQVQVYLS